ncbi:unnamed protein product [Prorocentrum cordatum]|uniref:Uncharacterized protein n=1 Tax=Prorocentrum cordatum TaxID=2364126 RepID=A0ABN9WKJ3_9DINO|nr:unnamed protein product [Polarella glacialis]
MIAPGDLICVVNGVRGTDGMMAVLRNADVLEFEIEFMKSTGTYACDFPELREDLKQALPEYEVSWSKVTTAVLKSKQAGGFLTKGPQYSFEVNLLRTGMLELTNLAPKTKSAKHQKEFVRVSALVADVGSREVRRRQGEEDDESEQDDEFEQDDAFVVDGEEVVGTPAAGVGTPATTPQHRKAEAAVASPAGPLAPPPPPAGIFGWSPQRAAPASGGQFSFVGAVGSKPGSRPNGKFTSSMKALSESYKKGDLSEVLAEQDPPPADGETSTPWSFTFLPVDLLIISWASVAEVKVFIAPESRTNSILATTARLILPGLLMFYMVTEQLKSTRQCLFEDISSVVSTTVEDKVASLAAALDEQVTMCFVLVKTKSPSRPSPSASSCATAALARLTMQPGAFDNCVAVPVRACHLFGGTSADQARARA